MDPSQNPFRPPQAQTTPPAGAWSTDSQATRASRPGVSTAAAIIWVAFGSLNIVVQLYLLVSAGRMGAIGGLLIGLGFLSAGIRSLTGKSRDPEWAAAGAILFGLLSMLGGIMLARGSSLLIFVLLQTGILLVSGVLALVGRAGYREWRAGKDP